MGFSETCFGIAVEFNLLDPILLIVSKDKIGLCVKC